MRKEIEKLLQSVQKPARYAGGELNSVMKDKSKVALRYAFCFPDTYEIGMSHLGMKILYGVANAREDTWCERVFAPADDMEALMRAHGEPLFALESGDPIKDFDMIGFTMQYELSYTNILNMLDLAGVPLRAGDRKSLTPIVAFGGPCACNPEPVAEFADIIFLGEGEETTNTVLDLLKECKESGKSKQEFLEAAMHIQGIYVPSFYEDSYNPDGTLRALTPTHGAPATVKKSIVSDMNKCYYPDSFVVPFIDIVHDRAVEEIFRGCIRGCRFRHFFGGRFAGKYFAVGARGKLKDYFAFLGAPSQHRFERAACAGRDKFVQQFGFASLQQQAHLLRLYRLLQNDFAAFEGAARRGLRRCRHGFFADIVAL